MKNLIDHLRSDYEYDLKKLPNDNFGERMTEYIDVLQAHYLICDFFESSGGTSSLHGIKNVDMLCSAVSRQTVEFAGVKKWADEYEIAATLFFGLVKNHPFHDGNKRTALLVLLNHLLKNKKVAAVPQKEFEQLTVIVAESDWHSLRHYKPRGEMSQADEQDYAIRCIAKSLRRMTRLVDKSFKPVAYFELENAISKYGYYFKDPYRNRIDICKNKDVYNWIGIKTKKQVPVKICNVAFPGMKRQVSKETLKEILKKLELDDKHGFDRRSIFNEAIPMYKLIQDYEGPLKRLRDK